MSRAEDIDIVQRAIDCTDTDAFEALDRLIDLIPEPEYNQNVGCSLMKK